MFASVVAASYWFVARGVTDNVNVYYAIIAIFVLVVGIACAYALVGNVVKPVAELEKSIKQVKEGNFNAEIVVKTNDDIGALCYDFNAVVGKIKQLMQEDEQKRKYEIKALRDQINPHFLHNTLTSILWMIEMENNDEAIEMTASLARLFRVSVSDGNKLVPVGTEVDYIKSYLEIQKMRYKDKLVFEIDAGLAVRGYYTPVLILQPLVENAIYHGIENKPGVGTITVTARKDIEADHLIFTVEDDGAGMDEEKLAQLLDENFEGHRGVGILNTNQRIKLYFGDAYGIQFESRVGHGTKATIILPIRERENVDLKA